jgi:hypothetical protein
MKADSAKIEVPIHDREMLPGLRGFERGICPAGPLPITSRS